MKLYGRVTAEEMFGNRRLFDNTTIMNDDELKLMGLFKSFDVRTHQPHSLIEDAIILSFCLLSFPHKVLFD